MGIKWYLTMVLICASLIPNCFILSCPIGCTLHEGRGRAVLLFAKSPVPSAHHRLHNSCSVHETRWPWSQSTRRGVLWLGLHNVSCLSSLLSLLLGGEGLDPIARRAHPSDPRCLLVQRCLLPSHHSLGHGPATSTEIQ